MKRLIACLLLAFAPLCAEARVLTVSWTNPTTNTDGTPLPPTGPHWHPENIREVQVQIGTCNGSAFGSVVGYVVAYWGANTVRTYDISPGVWCIRAIVRNVAGYSSASSNVVRVLIDSGTSNPVIGLSAQ